MSTPKKKVETIVQMSHTSRIFDVAVSSDKQFVATCSEDDAIVKLWNLKTGTLIRNFVGHTSHVKSVEFSPDNKYILSGCWDYSARLWDIETGKCVQRMFWHSVEDVCFLPEGDDSYKMITAGSIPGHTPAPVFLWEMGNNQPIALLGDTLDKKVTAIALSEDAKTLAAAGEDGKVVLLNLDNQGVTVLEEPDTHIGNNLIRALAFGTGTQNSFFAISRSHPQNQQAPYINVWDLQKAGDGTPLFQLRGPSSTIHGLAFSPDANYLACSSGDTSATLWELQDIKPDGMPSMQIGQHGAGIEGVAFAPAYDGLGLVTGSHDKTAALWSIPENELVASYEGHAAVIWESVMSPGGRFLVEAGGNDTLKYWDLEKGELVNVLQPSAGAMYRGIDFFSVDVSLDGRLLAAGTVTGDIMIWDTESYELVFDMVLQDGNLHEKHPEQIIQGRQIRSVRFSPEGEFLAIGTMDYRDQEASGRAYILELPALELHEYAKGKANWNCNVGINMQTGWAAVSFDNNREDNPKVVVFNFYTNEKYELPGHQDRVRSICINRSGQFLATACQDYNIRVWNLENLQQKEAHRTLNMYHLSKGYMQDHEDLDEEMSPWLVSVDLSLDGQQILVGNRDSKAYLIDMASQQIIRIFAGHDSEVFARFSADERYIVTGSRDSTTRIWDAQTGQEIADLVSIGEEDWAVIAPPSYVFDASSGAMSLIHFSYGTETILLDQLKKRYYQPGLLRRLMDGEAPHVNDVEDLDEVELEPEIEAILVGKELDVKLVERSGGIGRLQVFINFKKVFDEENESGKKTFKIDLSPFEEDLLPEEEANVIRIIAFNKAGWLKSKDVEIFISPGFVVARGRRRRKSKGLKAKEIDMYGIIIGTSKYNLANLKLIYPDVDAMKLTQTMELIGKPFYKNIHLQTLTSDPDDGLGEATKTNIRAAFKSIEDKAKSQDVLFLFLAGHGETHSDGDESNFYYLTKDLSDTDLRRKAIRDKGTISGKELDEWINQIKAQRRVLVLDTCHSGGVTSGLFKTRSVNHTKLRALEEMKDNFGTWILAGSTEDDVSYESSSIGHGFLTFSLLKGIKGGALENKMEEPTIDVQKLLSYSVQEVPMVAKQHKVKQTPVLKGPNDNLASFFLGIAEDETREKIELPLPKPIFVRSVFLNIEDYQDNLGLANALDKLLKNEELKLFLKQDVDFLFIDQESFGDAFKISGAYSKKGSEYEVVCNVFQNGKAIKTGNITFKGENAKALAEQILAEGKKLIR